MSDPVTHPLYTEKVCDQGLPERGWDHHHEVRIEYVVGVDVLEGGSTVGLRSPLSVRRAKDRGRRRRVWSE